MSLFQLQNFCMHPKCWWTVLRRWRLFANLEPNIFDVFHFHIKLTKFNSYLENKVVKLAIFICESLTINQQEVQNFVHNLTADRERERNAILDLFPTYWTKQCKHHFVWFWRSMVIFCQLMCFTKRYLFLKGHWKFITKKSVSSYI